MTRTVCPCGVIPSEMWIAPPQPSPLRQSPGPPRLATPRSARSGSAGESLQAENDSSAEDLQRVRV